MCCVLPGARASLRCRCGLAMALRGWCRNCRVQFQAELGELLPRLAHAHALDRAIGLGGAIDRSCQRFRRVALRLVDDHLRRLVGVAAVRKDEEDVRDREEKVSGCFAFSAYSVEDADITCAL